VGTAGGDNRQAIRGNPGPTETTKLQVNCVISDYEGCPVLPFGRQPRSDEVPERRRDLFDGGDP